MNLFLRVGALRADGFHELVTVFQAVDLIDEVRVRPAAGLRLRLSGEGAPGLPTGPDNLAWRAAALLAEHAGVAAEAVIEIHKAIPVAGGMAGGSADAAATLLACATLWQTGTSQAQLRELAAELGSDVAFGLVGGTALGTGRGEVLTPAPTNATLHWVFALAGFGIATADAYRELDRQRAADGPPAAPGAPDRLLAALLAGDPHHVAAELSNDLQSAARRLAPTLDETLAVGRDLGALAGIVCGSGPTVAFLSADAPAASRLATQLRAARVCRAVRVATGPVPGAQVVT